MNAAPLDPLALGLVLAGIGILGTLVTLFVFSLIVDLLKRLFPAEVPGPKSLVPGQGPVAGSESRVESPTPTAGEQR